MQDEFLHAIIRMTVEKQKKSEPVFVSPDGETIECKDITDMHLCVSDNGGLDFSVNYNGGEKEVFVHSLDIERVLEYAALTINGIFIALAHAKQEYLRRKLN